MDPRNADLLAQNFKRQLMYQLDEIEKGNAVRHDLIEE